MAERRRSFREWWSGQPVVEKAAGVPGLTAGPAGGGVTGQGFPASALGEQIPQITNGWYYAREGINLANRFAAYSTLYRSQPSVATVVDKIANSAARLTVKLWTSSADGGRDQDTASPLARLLARPSVRMSPYNFWRWTFSTYEVYGEAFWHKQRDSSGRVVSLDPMHPARIAVERDENGKVVYLFSIGVASAGILRAPEDDVVAFTRYNPDNLMRGISRLEPLRTTLMNEDAARRANESWWDRGARPSVVLKHPGELSQGAQDRLRQSFDARHSGASNMGGTAVLEEGMDAQIIQLNAEEMQYIESRKLNMTEVCMVFDVPPPVVHILDHATFSNITEQMRSMYRDTMAPRLEDVESVIDHALVAEFYPAGDHAAEFDLTDVLRGDFESRASAVQMLRSNGVASGNESREIMGLPRSEDPQMDKLFANAALVELGAPAQRVSITEAGTADPAQAADAADTAAGADAEAADAAKSIVRTVMGKAGRAGGDKAAIKKALIEQHAQTLEKFFARQKGRAAAPGVNLAADDPELAGLLHGLSKATADAVGAKVARDLGGTWNGREIAAWLSTNAADTAKRINATTAAELKNAHDPDIDPLDTVEKVYGPGGLVQQRAGQISVSRVALIAGLASLAAATQSGARTKTWVAGENPRSTHASMAGETVPLGERFSNGMDGPGDYSGGADEVANCNCDLVFN